MSDFELSPSARGVHGDGIDRGRLRRSAPLVGLTARLAHEALVARLRGRRAVADRIEFHVRSAERYAELLGHSKGALMKAGQMASFALMSSAVPPEIQSIYQTALMGLCDDAPPMAPELACEVLEHELGQRVETVFAQFDWEPLAAASIGQVHAAQLHDGRAVAVKVQYPGAADAIRADMKNTELLATFLTLTVGGMSPRRLSFDLRGAAREMGVHILEELDYRLEAASQAEFADYYRGHPFIHVPGVVDELCTGRVLTQELVRGLSWSDALTARQELRDQWAEAIYRFAYGTYERIYQFNADPHPGNYVFHEDGSVSFLDFGCVKRFSREQVQMMDVIVRESLRNDVLGTWRACVEAGFFKSSDPVTPEEVFAYWREDGAMLWAQQRFVVTPEYAAKRIERRCSPNGPSANAFRHITMSPEYAIMSRMEVGVMSVVAQLRAGTHWGSIAAEHFENAPPFTAMGKREHAFFEGTPSRKSCLVV
ncbi:MAG TPA: AarF/ABC1/UbiB kinase family protein [Solirubrobacteraceae bacterium]|jgi:predicted unusual protein kinase regulating ubiquinone biosynthesis (AarF/ABC1/UbiB family)|nr:AarF/ABC1/UbiB kinase family protein [Solirubrobacteraceae bacterium]